MLKKQQQQQKKTIKHIFIFGTCLWLKTEPRTSGLCLIALIAKQALQISQGAFLTHEPLALSSYFQTAD